MAAQRRTNSSNVAAGLAAGIERLSLRARADEIKRVNQEMGQEPRLVTQPVLWPYTRFSLRWTDQNQKMLS